MKVRYIGQGVYVIWADGEKLVLRTGKIYDIKEPFYTYLKKKGMLEDVTE